MIMKFSIGISTIVLSNKINLKGEIMKKSLFLFLAVCLAVNMHAQTITDPFFDRVSYVGALDGTNNWTTGWTNWTPEETNYADATVTKGNALFDFTTSVHITTNETWSGVILLDGWVYVDDGVSLTISAGTIIRATEKSALIVQRGGKIYAIGNSANPIVFTSNQGVGLRGNSDWAGLVLCGKGINNLSGGAGVAEGGIGASYGGSDNTDNSGVLKYVRIEFPGYEVATGSEVNGLTLYSVGSGTTIDYVQVSNSGDDGFEWFGGAVNAKHLISYRTEDDDFDTDNGFIGLVQFGIIARDSSIVDSDTANGFESDNDATGSSNSPKTNALFSNISAFGPSANNTTPTTLRTNHNEGSTMRLRRNTRLQIYNSVFLGFGRGLRLESEKGWAAAASDSLTVQNTIIAGVRNDWFKTDVVALAVAVKNWYLDPIRKNDTIALATDVKIADPFNYSARNFQPTAGSPVFNASYWYFHPVSVFSPEITDPFFEHVDYSGAFGLTGDWTAGWTNWAPENENYPDATITKGNGLFDFITSTHITSNESWSGVILLDGWVYVNDGATLTIAEGTIIRGSEKSALIIQRGGKIMAEGTSASPIVFTSNQGTGLRGNSDWAGLVICGRGINNLSGGNGVAEGGIGAAYGGVDNEDNSGVLKYVRIEFPGYEVTTGSEVNGLTLYSVGSGTTIDYVQISNSGDDGFEWFGGAVNAKHLVSYRTEDDDFDTDNGFVGKVQFGVIARDSSIVDSDTANGFESDNDATGSSNSPKTNALFSNISAFGPSVTNTSPSVLKTNHNEGAAMRLRRNTRLQIYNSVFAGFGRGLRLESEKGWASAGSDSLTVQNTIIAGIRNDKFKTDVVAGASAISTWFLAAERNNDTITLSTSLKITDPFNYTARNFMPMAGSPVLTASIWWKYVSPVAPTAILKKVIGTPIIDGSADDFWTEVPANNIARSFGTDSPTIGDAGSTYWKAVWNDLGVYVLVNVNDNTYSPWWAGAVPSENWRYDQTEVYFDVNAVLKDGQGPGGAPWTGSRVGHHQFAPKPIQAEIAGGKALTVGGNGSTFAYKVTDPSYTVEYFVPYTKLLDQAGVEVDKAGVIGFDVYIIDNDITATSGSTRAVWANAGGISEAYNNMDECGTITLGAETVTIITSVPGLNTNSQLAYISSNMLKFRGFDSNVDVQIYSILGQQLIISKNVNEVNVSGLEKGVYLVRVNNGKQVFKVMKQ